MPVSGSILIKRLAGFQKRRGDWLFRRLYYHGIFGMNYSNPNHFENGEMVALRQVQRWLNTPSPVIFDVGANIGEYAQECRQVFGPAATIHAFEPGLHAFTQLQARMANDPHTTVHRLGLGATDGELVLKFDAPGSTTASVYDLPADHPWHGKFTETVRITTIDGFCKQAGIDRVHFLKIDVEGHELPVLTGASGLLASGAIDCIQFEFGFRQIDSRTYFRDFCSLLLPGYQLFRILKDGLLEITVYHEGLEIFVGVSNFIAKRRAN